jgi:hypothetical protein
MSRVVSSVRGSSELQGKYSISLLGLILELNALQAELKGLHQMQTSLQSQLSSLESLYRTELQRNTSYGIVLLLMRHLFALYCVYRIVVTGWSNFSLLLGRPRTSAEDDPVSRFLAIFAKAWMSTTQVPLDIDAYRRLIGFVLVGMVIAGSVNAVADTVQRLSKSSPLSPALATLSICWISGTYFISTAVMLRSNLPEQYLGGIGHALGSSLKRGIFEEWFDIVFFLVALATGLGLLIARSWNYENILEFEGKEV